MKTEPNDLMHPFEEQDGNGNHYYTHYGLTKREYFAALAMQGLIANAPTGHLHNCKEGSPIAVEWADALIKALND